MFERFKTLKNESAPVLSASLPAATLSDKELAARARENLRRAAEDLNGLFNRGYVVEVDFAIGACGTQQAACFRTAFRKTETSEL